MQSSDSENEVVQMDKRAPKRLGEEMEEPQGPIMSKKARKLKAKQTEKYVRKTAGKKVIKTTKDKKLKAQLARSAAKFHQAAVAAAEAEVLLPSEAGYLEAEGMEKTYKFTQEQLADNLDVNTAGKIFNLELDAFAPYRLNYSRNGRHLALGGQKGHIAVFDTLRMDPVTEFHVNERVHDIQMLHNESMIAVAQTKYAYIYDGTGAEVHCLKDTLHPFRLDFLPYHYLLTSIGKPGILRYQDVSTGKIVAQHNTRLGPCQTMCQNPWNAVIHLGHSNGMVTLWTPNMKEAAVKIQCHQGPVQSISVDIGGRYMATAGLDRRVKIWDIRNYQELQTYMMTTPASSVEISQRGALAVGFGPTVQVWTNALVNKAQSPYMTERLPGKKVACVRFQPFEDVLSIGHSKGMRNIVVPGVGEPNFDTFEANPFETTKQRRETEVRSLLEKLQPGMITLNPMEIGRVDDDAGSLLAAKRETQALANNKGKEAPKKEKKRMRGRNKISNKLRRKQQNVIDEQRARYTLTLEERKKEQERQKQAKELEEKLSQAPTALSRFYK